MHVPDLGPRGEGWVLGQLALIGAIGLAGLLALPVLDWPGPVRAVSVVVGVLAIAAGGPLAVRAVMDLGDSLSPFPRPRLSNRLVTTGAYRYVRHPVYTGIVLAGIGWGLVTGSLAALALSIVLLGWFDLKSRREEVWMAARHAGYRAYRARTRRFVPFIY